MTSAGDESDEYLPDDDSEDSFDEDERPNRWRGPKSTWQQLNHEEIDTSVALKEIHDRDLSIHLYNAFALKQRHKKGEDGRLPSGPVPGKDINAATGQTVQADNWMPQRSWTAWPMRVDKVPPPDDVAKILLNDPDERFTFRKAIREMPSTALEEIIGAEILKAAKEKFNARPWIKPNATDDDTDSEPEEDGDDEGSDGETGGSASVSSNKRSRSRSKSVKRELESGDEKMDIDERAPEENHRGESQKKRRFIPVVSTDDDLSYSLLRPSVRHILSKLDTTLTILHNAQESTLNYQSDSADSETSESSYRSSRRLSRQGSQTPTPGSRKRGRPLGSISRTGSRGRSRARSATALPEEDQSQSKKDEKAARKRSVGRPRKTYPRLDGETDREHAIRIARLRKEPIPIFPDDSAASAGSNAEDAAGDSGNSGDGEDEDAGGTKRGTPTRRRKKTTMAEKDPRPRSASQASSTTSTGRRRSGANAGRPRVGLRDWRDVLGAAALAGFPAAAVDRAARRCADLFGQSMVLHTLVEGPAGRKAGAARMATTTYAPGMPRPAILEEDPEDEDEEGRRRRQVGPRGPPGFTSEDEVGPSTGGRARSRSSASRAPASRRSRSRSASATPGPYMCVFRDCPRAAEGEGFARRPNLVRHLKLVHGWVAGAGAGEEGTAGALPMEEVDSEDEMHGAVHVDGFLRPIRMRPGWRGEDAAEEPRRRRRSVGGYRRGRSRGRRWGGEVGGSASEEDGDGDTRMGGAGEYDE